jgi:hypothetical protein
VGIGFVKDKLLKPSINKLNRDTRNALVKGVLVAIITAIIYLMVVVITTPNLPASTAINAALKVNGIIIIGLTVGIGIQVFASTYSKRLGCRFVDQLKCGQMQQQTDIRHIFNFGGRTGSSASGGGTVMSSFLSFFSLVPLGCCGSWLFILSLLPSVFGGTISVILIEYSTILSYVGLALVLGLAGISVQRLRKDLNGTRILERQYLDYGNDDDDNKNASTSTLQDKLEKSGNVDY